MILKYTKKKKLKRKIDGRDREGKDKEPEEGVIKTSQQNGLQELMYI